MVISTRLASLCPKVISRTRSPTLTASSTRADSSRGVDTATSTPHDSLYSHSVPRWLTRATTRGTPYSVLASSETTRLTLSSPVAATTTLHRSRPASSSELISHASASSHSARGTLSTLIEDGFWSISSTSWPFSSSSRARDLRGAGQRLAPHVGGGPADRREGRDAEPLVHLSPARVVDARRDLADGERL